MAHGYHSGRSHLPGMASGYGCRIGYGEYGELLRAKRYRGWMLVEVSRQLQIQPGYDAVLAARRSYEYLASRLRAAGLRPGRAGAR